MDNFLTDSTATRRMRRLLLLDATLNQMAHNTSREEWLGLVKNSITKSVPHDITQVQVDEVLTESETLINGLYNLVTGEPWNASKKD